MPLEPIKPNLTNMFFGNGKALTKAMQILPSAMWQRHRQVYCFLFAYRNVSDCFLWWLGTTDLVDCSNFHFTTIVLENLYGIKPSLKQLPLCYWQMKNNTLAGSFGFVGFKNGFYQRQNNWKYKPFLELTKAMKTLPI